MLINGGLPCTEVTFSTDAAEESIRAISKKFSDMFVGAGSVLTTEQVDRAISAGVKFIVSPGGWSDSGTRNIATRSVAKGHAQMISKKKFQGLSPIVMRGKKKGDSP